MRPLFAMSLLTTCVLASLPLNASPLQDNTSTRPCRARTIYLAETGASDEGARFRQELERQLVKKNFVLAARAEDADAVLRGAFSRRGVGRESELAFEAGELKDARGERVWHANFYFTNAHAGDVAAAVAGNLRDACRR